MVQNHYYDDPVSGWTLIDQIRLGETKLPLSGKMGASGSGSTSIWIDDPEAVYDFVAQRRWYVEETDAPGLVTLTGTVGKSSSNTLIFGTGTAFLTEASVGREIVVPGGGGTDYLYITNICSDTILYVDRAPSYTATGQTATLPSLQRVWTGYTGDQVIERGSGRQGGGEFPGSGWPLATAGSTGRDWQLDLVDLNTFLHFRIIQESDGADRPAETVSQRMSWLLGVSFMTGVVYDEGLVGTSTTAMDAANYTGRFVDEVLNDLSQTSGWNHGLYWHEATGHYAMYFQEQEATVYRSGAKISNIAADINTANGIWPAWQTAQLRRSGQKVIAGAYTPYSGGSVYRTKPSTATTFAWRDANAGNSNIKNASTANDYADRYLDDNDEQDMLLTLTVTMPAANVNDIMPFQQVRVRLQHLPWVNCIHYRWCRVIKKTVSDHMGPDGMGMPGLYDVALELSPSFLPCAADTDPCDQFVGNAFAGLLRSDHIGANPYGLATTTLKYEATGDSPPIGWYSTPTVGPLEVVTPTYSGYYRTIHAKKSMTVRVQLVLEFSTVTTTDTASVQVYIIRNGSIINIGSDSLSTGGGLHYWSGTLSVDVHDVELLEDDLVEFQGYPAASFISSGGWTNFGTNDTFFRVGRGTFLWNSGTVTWTGP